jgi:hypothetical protein
MTLRMPAALWPWLTLAGQGFFHGINPAMGWLFEFWRPLLSFDPRERCRLLAHRDRSHFGGRTSLSGHNGHGWSGGRPDPDANDPYRTSASFFVVMHNAAYSTTW